MGIRVLGVGEEIGWEVDKGDRGDGVLVEGRRCWWMRSVGDGVEDRNVWEEGEIEVLWERVGWLVRKEVIFVLGKLWGSKGGDILEERENR